LGGGRGLRIAILGEDGEPVEYGEERRPRVRGAGGLERGAGDLVGASEHAKGLDEVILEGGLVGGDVDALEEDAERGLDVARGRERPAERDGGGEVGVDDAERGGLRGAVGEVGAAPTPTPTEEAWWLLQRLAASESRRQKAEFFFLELQKAELRLRMGMALESSAGVASAAEGAGEDLASVAEPGFRVGYSQFLTQKKFNGQ